LLVALIGVLVLWSWLKRAPPTVRARLINRLLVFGGLALLLVLLLTGRLNPIFALLGAVIPLVPRILSALRVARLVGASAAGRPDTQTGQSTKVETRYLRMILDHDSGSLDGEVIEGRFCGRKLSELGLSQLLGLLSECRANDEQSSTVLETYLDRNHGDSWREHLRSDQRANHESGTMTVEEAYAVLGINPGATETEIVAAHRRLMQKLHPDRGGSNYLAAKLNQAKDILLGI
jgi:hypothetical protein